MAMSFSIQILHSLLLTLCFLPLFQQFLWWTWCFLLLLGEAWFWTTARLKLRFKYGCPHAHVLGASSVAPNMSRVPPRVLWFGCGLTLIVHFSHGRANEWLDVVIITYSGKMSWLSAMFAHASNWVEDFQIIRWILKKMSGILSAGKVSTYWIYVYWATMLECTHGLRHQQEHRDGWKDGITSTRTHRWLINVLVLYGPYWDRTCKTNGFPWWKHRRLR